MILITLSFLPISLLLFNMTSILICIGMHPESSKVAGHFAKVLSWGFYMDCMFQSKRMFLTATQNTFLPMMVQLCTICIHPLWCYLFVEHLNFGVTGCAIAQNITYTLQLMIIIVCMECSSSEEMKQLSVMPSLSSFEGFGAFLKMARITVFLEALELWSYEVIALMAGYLSVSQQASLAIDWSISFLLVYIPYSFYMSLSSMIGAALGEGNILKAKQIFKLTFYICSFFGTLIIIFLYIYADKIISLYDEDRKIIKLSSAGLISYCFAVFPPYFTEMML